MIPEPQSAYTVVKKDGRREPINLAKLDGHIEWACQGLSVDPQELRKSLHILFYDGIETKAIQASLIMAAAQLIRSNPDYSFVASRLLLQEIYKEVTGGGLEYPSLESYLEEGVRQGRLDPKVLDPELFRHAELEAAITPARDMQFQYLGLKTLTDRYLVREKTQRGAEGKIIEMPQHFLMRVAMGLSFNEDDPTARAIEFYSLLSSFDYMSSTPTLFNAATLWPQLSSCYLSYVPDDLEGIFDLGYKENAMLSKFAGGIGSSWTAVRPANEPISTTNGKSSGIVPYLKIFNDVAVAVNQGGKRKGAFAPYLEPWHGDWEKFTELKEFAGDEHARTRDIFPAGWIPDLFMERVRDGGMWSFFSSSEFPELHDTWGEEFERIYLQAEADGRWLKQKPATEVWRSWLNQIYRTGAPWITFKDECNRRSPQQHVGVIHNSNLCTEITLNNSETETAVCNLGSVNIANHITDEGTLDLEKLHKTVRTAVRMLDNVIDLNYYPTENSKRANMRHRPVGLGVMGYAEALVKIGIDWESEAQVQFSDNMMEVISFYAISASNELAQERGAYETFGGSLWDQGILPIHTAKEQSCGVYSREEWDWLARKVAHTGMRNSNVMAIAPTATIANIIGTTECIQPIYERMTTKENLSGSFDVPSALEKYGKPELVKIAHEIDQEWLIRAAAKRQKWIDQSQSLNLYMSKHMKGRDLDRLYMLAWELGVKTTYYLKIQKQGTEDEAAPAPASEPKACSIDNPDCEACQ